ncbi:kyphoscoliosis peptidase [Plakobranchus ocellatus]|uniref:Kyphoscoliosis peptidase n=1 Tax=Plakobranchus ocellatus TaxID=259542 RepID=A0AAV3ZLF3_9GAST|nr:kyphoscoliosis peptidase [Plakobranchus ocellatus]
MEQPEFDADKMEDDLLQVAKIRRPGAALHNVVMAMFLLLGETHREMADWKTLADMITQTEKPEKRPTVRMSNLEASSIAREQVHLAKKLLAPLTLDKVNMECEAATSCFVWSREKIQEVDDLKRSLRKERSNHCNNICNSWLAMNDGNGRESTLTQTKVYSETPKALGLKKDREEEDDFDAMEKKRDKREVQEEELLVLKWLVSKDKDLVL